MKARNSSNLSVALGDNQGAMEAARALRDSSLLVSLHRHNRGGSWAVGWLESVGLSGCYAVVLCLICRDFVLSVNRCLIRFPSFSQFINAVMNYTGGNASLCPTE